MNRLIASETESGLSIGCFLQRRIPAAPAGYMRQLIRKGRLRLNGEPCSGLEILTVGDILILPASQRLAELLALGQYEQIDILLQGPDFLAVYKPAGLAVHRSLGHETDNLADRVNRWLQRQRQPYRALPVHRLDVGTSGPLLFAKGRRAAAALGGLFMAGKVEKSYLALVSGTLAEQGELLSPVPAKGRLRCAATRYRTLARSDEHTLLQLELISGRKHQLRRQLADAGHPLVNDRRYGGEKFLGGRWPFLHCNRLAWPGSADQPHQVVNCALPAELEALLRAARLIHIDG